MSATTTSSEPREEGGVEVGLVEHKVPLSPLVSLAGELVKTVETSITTEEKLLPPPKSTRGISK